LGAFELSLSSDLFPKISSAVSSGGNGTLKSGMSYLADLLIFISKYYQNEGKRIRTVEMKLGKLVVYIFIF
jgi:antitoxin component YwqK of YwqJK toxin-antitoxin module